MTHSRRNVPRRAAGALALALLGSAAVGQVAVGSGAAATGWSITVTPDAGLVDGQTVTVTGEGFVPLDGYQLFECQATAVDDELCDGGNSYMVEADEDGKIAYEFPVDAMILDHWGERFDCRSAPGACMIGVGFFGDFANSAVAPLTFDPGEPLLPEVRAELSRRRGLVEGQVIDVTGRGLAPSVAVDVLQCQTGVLPPVCSPRKSVVPGANRMIRTAFRVHEVLHAESGETIDCAAAPGACAIGVAWGFYHFVDRYDEVPISFGSDPAVPRTPEPGTGYRLAGSNGRGYSFGLPTRRLADLKTVPTIVDIASTPENHGYWFASADGGVFSWADARFFGSAAGLGLRSPIVGMAPTPTGRGYWLAAADGGVFAFGDARFLGSAARLTLRAPIVGIDATPSGRGYLLVASDGGVFSFGDARFAGSLGALRLAEPIVGIDATPSGRGYLLVASDGGVFSFGDARFAGSLGALDLASPVVGLLSTPSGRGYWLAGSDGGVFGFGDAGYLGGMTATDFGGEIVAIG